MTINIGRTRLWCNLLHTADTGDPFFEVKCSLSRLLAIQVENAFGVVTEVASCAHEGGHLGGEAGGVDST